MGWPIWVAETDVGSAKQPAMRSSVQNLTNLSVPSTLLKRVQSGFPDTASIIPCVVDLRDGAQPAGGGQFLRAEQPGQETAMVAKALAFHKLQPGKRHIVDGKVAQDVSRFSGGGPTGIPQFFQLNLVVQRVHRRPGWQSARHPS